MNVSVEELGPCKKLLRVELEPAAVAAEFETVTREFMREVSLPGFRPGKAPRDRVVKTFAPKIEAEVRRKLTDQSFRKALEEQKLRPITSPDVEEGDFGRETGLKFTATFEVEPEFELPEYRGLSARRETRAVTDADVDGAIAGLRDQRGSFADVARPVQSADYVVVNFTGAVDGRPITELAPTARGLAEQKAYWLLIEPAHFIPGFTDQLIGAAAGEKRTVKVTFPADFVTSELAGKEAIYEVEIVQVKEKHLPPLDDGFAQGLGATDLNQLRTGVRADLERELQFRIRRAVRDQLVSALLEKVNFELPDVLVQHETRSVVYDIVRTNQERGVSKEAIDEKKDEIYSVASNSARERVKAMLLLSRIAEKENIRASREEIGRRVVALAEQHNVKPEKLVKDLQEKNGFGQIQDQIVTAKVLDFLELHGKIEDVVAPAA